MRLHCTNLKEYNLWTLETSKRISMKILPLSFFIISILSDLAKKEGRYLQSIHHSLIQQLIKQFSIFFHYCCGVIGCGFSLFVSKSTNAFIRPVCIMCCKVPKWSFRVTGRGLSGNFWRRRYNQSGRPRALPHHQVCLSIRVLQQYQLYQCGCDMADEGIEYDLIIQDGPKKVNTVIITLHFEQAP